MSELDEIFRQHFNDSWTELQDSDTQDIKKLNTTKKAKQQIIDLVKQVKPNDYGMSKKGNELEGYIPAIQIDRAIDEYEQNLMELLGEDK